MHDATVRALIETAIEISAAEIPHGRSLQEVAKLRGRMLILQGTLQDLWPDPNGKPPRLTAAQLVDTLRKATT
jgi:hypothetical protein